jgi:cytochrome c556
MNVKSKEFYLTFQKGIDEVGDAKSFYKMAQDLMVGPETTLTTTMPPSIPENNSKYFKAAENYSRSMEHLKHVKQMMDNVETPALEESEKDCLNLFNQAVEKYLGSSEILNRYAKALYTGSDQKTEQGLITEARPKYEMAEQSMSEILMGGCKGEFFRFVRFSDETEKSAVYNAYKKFFAEKFDLYRSAIEMLFDYRPSNTTP